VGLDVGARLSLTLKGKPSAPGSGWADVLGGGLSVMTPRMSSEIRPPLRRKRYLGCSLCADPPRHQGVQEPACTLDFRPDRHQARSNGFFVFLSPGRGRGPVGTLGQGFRRRGWVLADPRGNDFPACYRGPSQI